MMSQGLRANLDWLLSEQRDLEIQDIYWPEVLDGNWRGLAREIQTQLDGYTGRVGIHGPWMGLTMEAYDPKVRTLVQERYVQGLEFAAELGATHMVVHSPFVFTGIPFLPNRPQMDQAQIFQVIRETLVVPLRFAQQIGCTIVVENDFDRSPGLLVALINSIDSPHLRLSLDIGHAYVSYHLNHAPPVDYWIQEAGALLAHVHIHDNDGYFDRHWVPGSGNVNWRAVFAALNRLERQPRLLLEVDADEVQNAAEWFKATGLAH
jgi:sugar phosphate isomerase/epimerase